MIYSRFGSEFVIVSGDLETGIVTGKRKEDGKLFPGCHITEYRADNGIKEIEEAIEKAIKKINIPVKLSEIGFKR